MKKFILTLTTAIFFFHSNINAQKRDTILSKRRSDSQQIILKNGSVRIYSKPKFFDFIIKAPKNFVDINKNLVNEDHAYYLIGAVAGTLAFIPFDQKITDNSRYLANKLGMNKDNNYNKLAGFIKLPKDFGSCLYLLGNGSTVVFLGAIFASYGLIRNDYRAIATASGLVESLALSGIFSQTIKRITGRESPFIARENANSGGDWNFFPSFSAFAKDTPKYDAMPSGHLTTFMSALTVIADNYPDVKWIKPVGYTLAGALCFQMIQSEVHWFSDYPIAILMGYFIGKTIAKSRYTVSNDAANRTGYKISFIASRNLEYNMLGVKVSF